MLCTEVSTALTKQEVLNVGLNPLACWGLSVCSFHVLPASVWILSSLLLQSKGIQLVIERSQITIKCECECNVFVSVLATPSIWIIEENGQIDFILGGLSTWFIVLDNDSISHYLNFFNTPQKIGKIIIHFNLVINMCQFFVYASFLLKRQHFVLATDKILTAFLSSFLLTFLKCQLFVLLGQKASMFFSRFLTVEKMAKNASFCVGLRKEKKLKHL